MPGVEKEWGLGNFLPWLAQFFSWIYALAATQFHSSNYFLFYRLLLVLKCIRNMYMYGMLFTFQCVDLKMLKSEYKLNIIRIG